MEILNILIAVVGSDVEGKRVLPVVGQEVALVILGELNESAETPTWIVPYTTVIPMTIEDVRTSNGVITIIGKSSQLRGMKLVLGQIEGADTAVLTIGY